MSIYNFTEAHFPVRSKVDHLRDVAFLALSEGLASAITDMYVLAALDAGATQLEVQQALNRHREARR